MIIMMGEGETDPSRAFRLPVSFTGVQPVLWDPLVWPGRGGSIIVFEKKHALSLFS